MKRSPLLRGGPARHSAAARRGAAAYADGAQWLVEAKTHGSLLLFEGSERTEMVLYIDFCVRQGNIKSSVWFGFPSLSIPK